MTVGEQLRKARETRGFTLVEVTHRTKIQPWVLEAFEADRMPEQLSPIYVRGFLATYARFLHLAPEPLLTQLQWSTQPKPSAIEQAVAATQVQAAQAASVAPKQASPARKSSSKAAMAAAAAAAPVLSPAVQVQVLENPVVAEKPAAPAKQARQPVQIKLPSFKIKFPAIRISWQRVARLGLTAVAAVAVVVVVRANPLQYMHLPKFEIAKKPASANAMKVAKANKQAAAADKKAKAVAAVPANPAAKLASLAPVSEELVRQPAAPPQIPVVPVKPLELSLSASKTTWIQVRADGKLLTQQRLPRGAKEQWTAKKSFEIIVAKPSQVEIILNGQSVTPLAIAHKGRLSITHQGILPLPEDAS